VHLDDVPELRAEYKKKLASIELQLSGMVQVKVSWSVGVVCGASWCVWSRQSANDRGIVGNTTTDRLHPHM
jgi:hypothetical protein